MKGCKQFGDETLIQVPLVKCFLEKNIPKGL